MEINELVFQKNLLKIYGGVYLFMAPNGMKNLCQNKVLPIDIDVEDLEILEGVKTRIYDSDFTQVNTYQSRRGYTLLAYSPDKTVDEQYEFLFSLKAVGVDTQYLESIKVLQPPPPFTGDYFINRVGLKFYELSPELLNQLVAFCGLDPRIKQEVQGIMEHLDQDNIMDFLGLLYSYPEDEVLFNLELKKEGKDAYYFKDFFSSYRNLSFYNALNPIHKKVLSCEHVAVKKYLESFVKQGSVIPDCVQSVFDLYHQETGALKPDIKYLI
jgi:hypothetical protein